MSARPIPNVDLLLRLRAEMAKVKKQHAQLRKARRDALREAFRRSVSA